MAAAGIAFDVGKERLWEYEQKFGFYDRPGTGMLGEMSGWHDNWKDWADVRVANIGFGQGIMVSPMQLANAYATVANDGVMMQPHIVKEIRRQDGTPYREYKPQVVRRVVSAEVARAVTEMLHGVCLEGTGKTAVVEGYQTCGKTGSAQKAVNGSYNSGKFVASFVGFLPSTNPRAVILVTVDEPEGIHWGATCAAPVFREVGRMAMWHFKVAPDQVEPSVPVAGETAGSHPTDGKGKTRDRA
jgi:cell division protein FtsI/penicillin-binding protein 2